GYLADTSARPGRAHWCCPSTPLRRRQRRSQPCGIVWSYELPSRERLLCSLDVRVANTRVDARAHGNPRDVIATTRECGKPVTVVWSVRKGTAKEIMRSINVRVTTPCRSIESTLWRTPRRRTYVTTKRCGFDLTRFSHRATIHLVLVNEIKWRMIVSAVVLLC